MAEFYPPPLKSSKTFPPRGVSFTRVRKEAASLSRWYDSHRRDLPWRRTSDPYPIWISEVMLQQTQVTTVIPYYERFLAAFPTIKALADAPEPHVLALWSGLGYYSRARNLQSGARHVVSLGGKFPRTREAMESIPGIGPYTAGAVLSIAFDLPEAIVDGNVQRVLSRFYGWDRVMESTESKRFFWETAQKWVRAAESPRVLNQALMELGATICIKGTPGCGSCPLARGCVALRDDRTEEIPVRKARREKVDVHWIGLVLEHDGKVFLRPNGTGEWWAGLWDFPRIELKTARALGPALESLRDEWNAEPVPLGTQRHTVTHHRLHVVPAIIRLRRVPSHLKAGRWVSAEEWTRLPVSALAKKIARAWRSDSSPVLPLC